MEEEMKENIGWEIANIAAEPLQTIGQNLLCQCEECLCKGTAFSNPSMIYEL
jgi:hypothetical protein